MKRALVTGASGAIGSAISHALAATGLHVYVHANSQPHQVEQLATAIRECGGSAEPICFDVTDTERCQSRLQTILEAGPIQVLVNNAGVHSDAPMAGMDSQQWRHVVDVSLNGFYNVTHPLLLPMMGTRWGRIISISSIAGMIGNRGQTNYAAAKAGLHGASKSLAIELASRGITVNVVAPGIIQSPMTQDAFPMRTIKQLVPMQRAGRPEEVADLVAFLASERAAYISGQVIAINGAMA